jgi:hypothetical protein
MPGLNTWRRRADVYLITLFGVHFAGRELLVVAVVVALVAVAVGGGWYLRQRRR